MTINLTAMLKIYHNPRCGKSREGLEILEKSGKEYEVVLYMDQPPSVEELRDLIQKLGISPIDLVRKNERIWKEQFKGKRLSDASILKAMVEHPKLIERPIVVQGGKALIGRPPILIKTLL